LSKLVGLMNRSDSTNLQLHRSLMVIEQKRDSAIFSNLLHFARSDIGVEQQSAMITIHDSQNYGALLATMISQCGKYR
jgi:hypothetical protein